MNSSITTIIFDFGNVFVNWDAHALYKRFFSTPEAVDSFMQEIGFAEWNALQDAGRPFKEGVDKLSSEFPQHAELIQAYDTYWEESITDVHDGTIKLAHTLKDAGWDLYLLSNFSVEKFSLMQQRFDFLDIFNDMIISGEHNLVKPDPAIFQLTLKRINREAHECLFIDDSVHNIEVARQLGFHTILFQSSEQLEDELEKMHLLPKPVN
jgi:2-haloacid dehalogenase